MPDHWADSLHTVPDRPFGPVPWICYFETKQTGCCHIRARLVPPMFLKGTETDRSTGWKQAIRGSFHMMISRFVSAIWACAWFSLTFNIKEAKWVVEWEKQAGGSPLSPPLPVPHTQPYSSGEGPHFCIVTDTDEHTLNEYKFHLWENGHCHSKVTFQVCGVHSNWIQMFTNHMLWLQALSRFMPTEHVQMLPSREGTRYPHFRCFWIGDARNSLPWWISAWLIHSEFFILGSLKREQNTTKSCLGFILSYVEHFYIIHLQPPNNLRWGNRTGTIASALKSRKESTKRLSDFHKFTHHINHRDETWIQHLIFLTLPYAFSTCERQTLFCSHGTPT